ncbi:MAG: hypothetical protein B7X10_03190, partial [Burkholderiales bacterium 21-58-4]
PAHPDTFSGSGRGYRDSTKRNMPKRWFDELPHTHVALDDALGQGALFCNMLLEARRLAPTPPARQTERHE